MRTLIFLLLFASLVSAEEKKQPSPILVTGKFGKALDAAKTPLAFAGDSRYRTAPLSVECWAKLHSKRDFNILVSSDPKTSAQHWELYSYAKSGALAAFLPGYEPSEIVSKKTIVDDKWHHVAMTFDAKTITLYLDGVQVHTAEVKPKPGLKPVEGPLGIGLAVEGSRRLGCDGLIDDVRLSRIVRKITLPEKPHVVDADTIGVWRFDEGETILADSAWTPPPNATGEAWERMTDVDWVDGRLRKMDTGPTFNATMKYDYEGKPVTVYKGTAIRVGERGDGMMIFDRGQLRIAGAWMEGWLTHSDRRFGLLNTPKPDGRTYFLTRPGLGWYDADGKFNDTFPGTLSLPVKHGRYDGMYLHGKRVVLAYTVGETKVLEAPDMMVIGDYKVFTRTITIGPTKKPVTVQQSFLRIGTGAANPRTFKDGTRSIGSMSVGDVLEFPVSDKALTSQTYYFPRQPNRGEFNEIVKRFPPVEDPTPLTKPTSKDAKRPAARWPKVLVTKFERAKDDAPLAPYVIDTLTIPYDNPHNALFFCTGHDFLPDGRIAMCTAHGDVWLVKLDETDNTVHWKRFATGLYQPLGLKVVDGKIVVLERGQLTRLHDLHDNDEADFYENVCNDWHTGSGEHSYDTCLETDAEGNFYFFKTGDTNLPHGGCLMKVSKDGKKVEVFATGFRHPIGLGASPKGIGPEMITGADQEGNWMPATRVDIYKKGGFYGDMRAHHRKEPPKTYDGPLVWLPKEVDNSAGGQVWVPHEKFGLPKGQLLHLSYGRCKLYALLTQKVGDVDQAGAVDLGVKFLSGSARGRFSPKDGHLYITGLNGWQTAAKRDGCLQRVRYTGKALTMPVDLKVTEEGIRLSFAQELDAKSLDVKKWTVEQWNYRWSGDYGSKRWSLKDPKRQAQDEVTIDELTLSADRKSVLVKIKGLAPVMQMRIGYQVTTKDGATLSGAVHNTIHRVGKGES